MSLLVKIISLCLITVFLCAILRKYHPEYAIALVVAASVIIFISLIDYFELIFESIKEIMENSGINNTYIETILKITGIAYISEYASALFYDANESALGKKIEMAGKLVVFVITIPAIKSLLELIISFFGGG